MGKNLLIEVINMTLYKRGYKLERDIMDKLEQEGYYVIRSAGSHRLCDVIAIPKSNDPDPRVLCIQCKKTSKPDRRPVITRKELEEYIRLEREYHVKVYFALRWRERGKWRTEIISLMDYIKNYVGGEKS